MVENFDRDDFFKHLLEKAKQDVLKGTTGMPMFFLVGKTGIAMVAMPFDDDTKDKAHAALKMLIEKTECELYYSVFDAWMASPQKEKEFLKKEVKKVKSPEDFKKLMELAKGIGRPSTSPARKECLVISEYSKVEGTKSTMIPYEKKDGKVVFEKAFSDFANGYSRWNVWTPNQVTIKEKDVKA